MEAPPLKCSFATRRNATVAVAVSLQPVEAFEMVQRNMKKCTPSEMGPLHGEKDVYSPLRGKTGRSGKNITIYNVYIYIYIYIHTVHIYIYILYIYVYIHYIYNIAKKSTRNAACTVFCITMLAACF